jgi:hypothetical protein
MSNFIKILEEIGNLGKKYAVSVVKSATSIWRPKTIPYVTEPRIKLSTINSVNLIKPIKPMAAILNNPFLNKYNKFQAREELKEQMTIGYHTNDFGPIVFADNVHNEQQSLNSRVVVDTPHPDLQFMNLFVNIVWRDRKQVLPGMGKIQTSEIIDSKVNYSKKQWSDLKPEHRAYLIRSNAMPRVKATLYKTFKQLYADGIDEWSYLTHSQLLQFTQRSSFLKMENLLYRTLCGDKEKAPRFISGAEAQFVCLVGPWMMACQDRFKKCWNIEHFITFGSGKTNEEIGKGCEKHIEKNVFEDDIGVFDSSVRVPLLELEHKLFVSWGAPRAVNMLIKQNINTRGRTKWGFRYKVPGTRKSGDPYTSLGNSLLNGLMHYFIYRYHTKCSPLQTKFALKMFVQGDDNLGFSSVQVPWVPYMLKLGFTSEAVYRKSVFQAEYCSSRLYPTKNGLVLGPKPGKVLAKFGYYVQPPKHVPIKQLLRGSALGLYKQCYFIPPIKIFLDKVLKYTAGEKAYFTKQGDWQNRTKAFHEPVIETYHVLKEIYGYEKEYDLYLENFLPVTPSHIKFPFLESMMDIDTSGPQLWFGD